MSFRITTVLVALPALLGGLLVTAPSAGAASYQAYVKTKAVSISSGGTGRMAVSCHAKSACKGKIWFEADSGTKRKKSFNVRAGRTAYVSVAMHTGASSPIFPYNAPSIGRDYRTFTNVKVVVAETSPKKKTHTYKVATETPVKRQQIQGDVSGPNGMTALKVELIRTLRGGNTQLVKTAKVRSDDSYSMVVNLGANNSQSNPYRLRVSGKDQDGNFRSWFYRGGDNSFTGGGAYLRDSSVVRAKKYNAFDADFPYASISGKVTSLDPKGVEVTVASPPASFSGNSTTLRELDYPRCANIFGQTRAASNGNYSVNFLPATTTIANRYMIGVRKESTAAWYGDSTTRYGSCYDITRYSRSRSNLITLANPLPNKDFSASSSGTSVTIRAPFSSSFKPTTQNDRSVRLREKVPGTKILDTPVVREGRLSKAGSKYEYKFNNLAPGRYWVEVGRRTGCSDWYPSRFGDNRAYFKGDDRASERWKSFTKLSRLSGNANRGYERLARRADPNPATSEQNKIRSGYRGWMYRAYCKASGAGTINSIDVTNSDYAKTTSTNRKGATVRGHVSRTKGRTNKEMMVRLSSTGGTRVIRTAVTDGGGNFTVSGLASGKWTIAVNTDSWRGISRSFSGKHSITVKTGKSYRAGTLRFKG